MDKSALVDQSPVRSVVLSRDGMLDPNSQPFELHRLWRGLCSGGYYIRDHFSSTERHYLVVERLATSGGELRFAARRMEALRRATNGQMQKVIASDARRGLATVATDLQQALLYMGCHLPPSRIPLVLVMAQHAFECPTLNYDARYTELVTEPQILHVVSMERPELRLARRLSRTELSVLSLFAEGHSYAEIAEIRGTAIRTVANQLASTYERLKISGRSQLLHYIASC